MKYTTLLLIIVLLTTAFTISCQNNRGIKSTSTGDSINWKDSAKYLSMKIEEYYNNDENDSVYQLSPIAMKLCREHGIWHYYYYTWSIMAMTYIWDNQPNVAIKEAQQMQEDALARNDKYGLSKAMSYWGKPTQPRIIQK